MHSELKAKSTDPGYENDECDNYPDAGPQATSPSTHVRDPEMVEHHMGMILAGAFVFLVLYFGSAAFALTH